MKKLIALVLACLMAVGVFAGCAKQDAETSNPSGGTTNGAAGEPVEITWMLRCDEPKNFDSVMNAFNEKLMKDMNMKLNLKCIAPGDYNDKMQMAMTGGDDWDICFTASWANNYVNAAGKGAFLEITDEMLQQNCPDILKTIPERLWDGLKVNGKLYGVMNYQVMYDQPGIQILKSVYEEQKLTPDDFKDWDSLNATMEKLAKAYPDKYADRGCGMINPDTFLQESPISTVMLPVLMFNEETKKIDNKVFFEKIEPMLKAAKLWKDNNWVPADAATMKDEKTMMDQGLILTRYQRMKPGVEAALKGNNGLEWVVLPMGKPVINTGAVQSTVNAINVNSQHPNEALKLINYLYANKEAANILFFGLEGQDYELVDGRVKKLDNAWSAPQWMLGNQFNAMLTVNDVEGVWEETIKGNEAAEYDSLFGFVPNRTPVETELATIEAIWGEYREILYYGLRDYKEVVPEMLDKMEKAGLEKVTTEMQAQVDAFLASK